MSDLRELQERLKAAINTIYPDTRWPIVLSKADARAIAAALADAERYRWLREGRSSLHITRGPPWDMGHYYREEADKLIDAAMAEEVR